MKKKHELIEKLTEKANKHRQQVLIMLNKAGSGHPGGSLSAMDVLTVLYDCEMKVDSTDPDRENRDRFILSKGQACPALYSVLADEGFFDKGELDKLRKTNALLQGSACIDIPGVEMTTGSLGQGLSIGVGMALGAKYLKKDFRVYVMIGDGESQEGQIWEAAMAAAHYKLGNLTTIMDYNKLQGDAPVCETMGLEPLVDKWKAFGWETIEINGHDFEQILNAFAKAKKSPQTPTVIISHSIKGKGVSFMENVASWHGSNVPNSEELETALTELRAE